MPGRTVGVRQFSFLVHRHAGKTVVGRIAQDHENRLIPLDPLGAVALFLQFGKWQRLGRLWLPAGERVGEEDAGALIPVVRQRRVERLHGQPDLQMGDDERRGHDLEAEYAPPSPPA